MRFFMLLNITICNSIIYFTIDYFCHPIHNSDMRIIKQYKLFFFYGDILV